MVNYYLFVPKDEEYHTIDRITCAFTDVSRMTSFRTVKGVSTRSPQSGWEDYGSYVQHSIESILQNQPQDISAFSLREGLYHSSKKPGCIFTECAHERSTFLTCVFVQLRGLTKTLPFRVFDSCAGWGDRYIVCMAMNCERYIGVEPNSASKEGFDRAGHLLGDLKKHEILCDGCPEVTSMPSDCVDGYFSISFLSPPAWDSEFYSNDDKQSVNLYKR